MFKTAKIKLTAWYLLILMCITVSFSALAYYNVSRATEKALESQRVRMAKRESDGDIIFLDKGKQFPVFEIETLEEIQERTLANLMFVDGTILIIAGVLSYLLAGITLQPIEDMMEKQKRFISDAAHEIKTPLTALKTNIEVTLRDKNISINSTKETLVDSLQEIDKLSGFTNRLLKQSKYQNGLYKTEKSDLNISTILNDVIKKYSTNNIKANIGDFYVSGNATELSELFINLIDNAIKYGVPDKPIEVDTKQKGNHVQISVKDYGMGIAKEDIPHLFEPFYRADKSRNKAESDIEGYGLGLAIVKEIVDRHSGNIYVESELGQGTKFTVSLPIIKIK